MARKKTEIAEQAATQMKHTFTKAQLAGSKRFSGRRDLLNAILKDDQRYTISEVEMLIKNFMKGKVNE